MPSPLTPKPFNLEGLKAAWHRPRPDTWDHDNPVERWRWNKDMARAIARNNVAQVENLIREGGSLTRPVMVVPPNVRASIPGGLSWLAQAACANNVAMLELLTTKGLALDAPTGLREEENKPLLHHALHHDALEAAQWLIDRGVGWDKVSSHALFGDPVGVGPMSERCMIAWLTTWNRPWADPEDALRWARLALAQDDSSLLRCVLQRTPKDYWNASHLEQLWITAIQFDRDEGVRELLDAGVVPVTDLAQHQTFDQGDQTKQHALKEPCSRDPENDVAWWMRNDDVVTPWSWLVVRASARKLGERWFTVPEEITRMAETVAQEPRVWLQHPASNTVRQPVGTLKALSQYLDLRAVRDEKGNTPLHRWLGLAMETPELMTWVATTFPEWGETLNHAGQTPWALAEEIKRPRIGVRAEPFPKRMHEARAAWDTAVLNAIPLSTGPNVPRERSRL